MYEARMYESEECASENSYSDIITKKEENSAIIEGLKYIKNNKGTSNVRIYNKEGNLSSRITNKGTVIHYFNKDSKKEILSRLKKICGVSHFTILMGEDNPEYKFGANTFKFNEKELALLEELLNYLKDKTGKDKVEKMIIHSVDSELRNLEWHESKTEKGSIIITYGIH